MNSYIALDMEATGLSPRRDKIIELGAVKVTEGETAAEFSTFVNPGRPLDERITELTGITDDDLKDAPYIDTVIGDFADFCGDLPIVGHHVISDFSIIKQAAVNQKLSFEKEAVDTLKLSRALLPELPSKKLKDVCEYYGIIFTAHRAINDARATNELYKCLERDFYLKYPELFVPAKLNHKVKKESPVRANQTERIISICERHGLECAYDFEHMTMSEAGRLIDNLISKYGK